MTVSRNGGVEQKLGRGREWGRRVEKVFVKEVLRVVCVDEAQEEGFCVGEFLLREEGGEIGE